jgi:hypothetical protein
LEHRAEIYEIFLRNISRAQALLEVQNLIDIMIEDKDSIQEYINTKSFDEEKITIISFYNSISALSEAFITPEVSFEHPLYHDAVVSAVTSFEAYMKNRLIELMLYERKISKKVNRKYNKIIDFEEVKTLNINKYTIGEILSIHRFSFFKMSKVDQAFKKVLDERSDRFTIFCSEKQKKNLKSFIELRHLIIHKGGVVDSLFIRKTKCPFEVGDIYDASREYIMDNISELRSVVNNIERLIENK